MVNNEDAIRELAGCGICGDVNCNGAIDMGDVILLLNHVSDPETYPLVDEWAGDVNGDGEINMGDVVLLRNHVSSPDDFPLHCREAGNGLPIEVFIAAGLTCVAGIVYIILK